MISLTNFLYINEDRNIFEKHGVYDGQIKFCKELAIYIYEEIQKNRHKIINFNISKEELDTIFDGIFFKELKVRVSDDETTGYEAKNSNYDNKAMLFNSIEIYINSRDYKTKESLLTMLTHEITHAYEDWNRHQKQNIPSLFNINNNTEYKKVVSKSIYSDNGFEKICAQIIYTFSSVERNAYLSELGAELYKTNKDIKTYKEALKIFKTSDTWIRFTILKNEYETAKQKNPDEFCNYYRKLKKTSITNNKIFKYIDNTINKAFDKMMTNLPKLYYDYVSKKLN